jgi:hypothetical protein
MALLSGVVPAASAAGPSAGARFPAVLHVGQIAAQNVPSQKGCEPDTLVEPNVAVSPFNSRIQVAVAHDCRFASGGAVDIAYAWTHDGGAHWHNAPMPGLTRVVGGAWDRASDPVVAFGPDGSVYVSALVFDNGCPTGVTVSRSVNGGATFGPPMLVHKSTTCAYSDDKNWLVVDTQPSSPFYGRLYQFWTAFLSSSTGKPEGSPQVVRWSDDHGKHWSSTHVVSGPHANTQNSQPVIQPDGVITDVYMDFGGQGVTGGVRGGVPGEHRGGSQSAASGSGVSLVARSSFGGAAWTAPSLVTKNVGGGPAGIRCCLPATAADPVTGQMYTVWDGNGPGATDPVWLSSSASGRHWSARLRVSPQPGPTIQHINLAVTAYGGKVFVTYGTRNTAVHGGNLVQQQIQSSNNGGASFGPPLSVGPRSNLTYAAVAGGKFPGDYVGASATASRLNVVWCRSSRPPNPNRVYHQTLYSAVLRP